jgi:hypothetical protein
VRGVSLPSLRRPLATAAIAATCAAVVFGFALITRDQPLIGAAVPLVLVVSLACARWPAAAVAALIFLSGTYGSLKAFGIVPAGPMVDLVLSALVVSVVISQLLNRREQPWWLWPGVAILCLYIAITFLEIATSSSLAVGIKSFSYQAWYMVLVPLLGLAGWRLRTYFRIYHSLLAIAFLVSAYAVFRQITGPAASEQALGLQSAGVFNTVGGDLKLLGSFPNRHELAFWATTAAPFALAATLIDPKAKWKLVGALTVLFCLTAAYATDVRAALPALVAGGGTVVVLNQIAGRGRGTVLAQTMAAIAMAATAGAVLFTVVVGPDSSRYSAILSPSGDPSWENHLTKWEAALQDLHGHPFGLGLGTAGRLAEQKAGPFVTVGTYAIDSSYLKIAYEEGFPVLVIFVLAIIALLVELLRRSVRARSPGVRALAIGAAGSLVAALPMWVTGQYMESLDTLFLWTALGSAIGAIAAERFQGVRDQRRQAATTASGPAAASEPAAAPGLLPAGQRV